MAMAVYTQDREISVGATSAVIDCTSGSGCIYDEDDIFGEQVYYRIRYSVNADMSSSSYTTSVSQFNFGVVFGSPFVQDITITGLTANTVYYYTIQGSYNNSTFYDAVNFAGVKGTFTTLSSGNPPNIDFTVSTTTGGSPLYVVLTGSNTGGALSDWTLNWGDGAFSHATSYQTPGAAWTQTSKIHNYVAIGTYTVTATATNADGANTNTKSSLIHLVAPTVTASFTVTTSDPGTGIVSVTLTDSSTTTDPLGLSQRLWTVVKTAYQTLGAEHAIFSFPVTKVVGAGGPWSVTLTETSVGGYVATITDTSAFTIPYVTVAASFTGTPLQGPIDLAVNFHNNSVADGMQALWNFGDTSTSTNIAAVVTHAYTTSGTFDVTLTVTGSATTTTGTAHITVTRLGYITAWPNAFNQNLGGLFRDVQHTLMSNPEDSVPCDAFDEFGGLDNLITIYYRRLREFLRETELTQTEATLGADAAGIYTLPTSLVKLVRVEVGGQNVNPVDRKIADLQYPGWATTTATGECYAYIYEPEDALTLRLVPMLTGQTIKVLYVAAPDTPSIPADCITWGDLPLPYAVSWVVKWGMLADLLRQEGELNDPVRAAFAEEIYQFGVQITKFLLYPRTK